MKKIRTVLELAASIPVIIIAVLTLADILTRAISGQAFIATYELTSILLPFMVFLALPLITIERSHISVNVLDSILPREYAWILTLIGNVIGIALLLFVSSAAWKTGTRAIDWNTTTTVLEIPLGYLVLFIAASLKLTAFIYAVQAYLVIYQQREKIKERWKS